MLLQGQKEIQISWIKMTDPSLVGEASRLVLFQKLSLEIWKGKEEEEDFGAVWGIHKNNHKENLYWESEESHQKAPTVIQCMKWDVVWMR
jgi:hypothetical protein